MLLHTTDRQTDRQNAELCRNISCFAEFRQNWVKPETDSIFGNAAILCSAQARRALEPAGRALEPAKRASEPAGRALEPAGRPGASWEGQLRGWGGERDRQRERTERYQYVVVP